MTVESIHGECKSLGYAAVWLRDGITIIQPSRSISEWRVLFRNLTIEEAQHVVQVIKSTHHAVLNLTKE